MSQVIESGSKPGRLAGSDVWKIVKGAMIVSAAAAIEALIRYVGELEFDNQTTALVIAVVAIALNGVRKLLLNTRATATVGAIILGVALGLSYGVARAVEGIQTVAVGGVTEPAEPGRRSLGTIWGPRTIVFRDVSREKRTRGPLVASKVAAVKTRETVRRCGLLWGCLRGRTVQRFRSRRPDRGLLRGRRGRRG